MLDFSHIINSQQDIKIFYNTGTWQTWTRPRKCEYIYIICIGGGAGGSGGGTSNNTVSSPGGGGAITRGLFNSNLLPDDLYVNVGIGGKGGVSTSLGENATKSYVSMRPNITASNIILTSGNAAASAGNTENIATIANMVFSSLGTFMSAAGATVDAYGTDVFPFDSSVITPGAYGGVYFTSGQINYPGSNIVETTISPLIEGGAAAVGSGNGGRGADGITSWKPFFSLGGAGGGSANLGIGGDGGNGGIGSGGGSGGAGSIAGGKGGDGGDGLVIMITF